MVVINWHILLAVSEKSSRNVFNLKVIQYDLLNSMMATGTFSNIFKFT